MQITIPALFNREKNQDSAIVLSDDGYDVIGFMDIIVDDKVVTTIHVSDLSPALAAFKTKWLEDRSSRGEFIFAKGTAK
jgi:hypothetical protein